MKKILFLAVIFGVMFSTAQAWAFTTTISNATLSPGESKNVTLNFAGNTDTIWAADIKVTYDPNALQLNTVSVGSAISGWSIQTNTNNPGIANIAVWSSSTALTAASGNLLTLNFTALVAATPGNYPVHLTQMDFSTDFTTIQSSSNTDGVLSIVQLAILRLNVQGDARAGFINVGASVPNTGNCGTISGYFICYTFPLGTQITLSPNMMFTPPESRFASWSVNMGSASCPGIGNCVFTLGAETRIVANFAANAQMASPAPNSTLSTDSPAITYDAGSRASAYRAVVTDKATSEVVYDSGEVSALSVVAADLPDSGEDLQVTLSTKSVDSNQWLDRPMTYNLKSLTRFGDANEDGNISAIDASFAGRAAVGLLTLTSNQTLKTNVNNITGITASDASWIAHKAVDPNLKMPVELP